MRRIPDITFLVYASKSRGETKRSPHWCFFWLYATFTMRRIPDITFLVCASKSRGETKRSPLVFFGTMRVSLCDEFRIQRFLIMLPKEEGRPICLPWCFLALCDFHYATNSGYNVLVHASKSRGETKRSPHWCFLALCDFHYATNSGYNVSRLCFQK